MRRWVRSEKGNTLIMMAGAMAVLAGFGILTIDIGRMLVTRTQLQNAADSGALAGASLFCESTPPTDTDVQNEVRLVGGANKALQGNAVDVDIPNEQITIERSDAANDVTVVARSNTRQFMIGLFSIFQNSDPDVPNPARDAAVAAVATARCGGTCSASCIKPWSIPDRWDDISGVPGYMGEVRNRENWQNNDAFDQEDFDDSNGNGFWDIGESYDDVNGNGQFDEEPYHPSLTGYGPDPVPGNILSPNGDIGLELVLHPGTPGDTPAPGQYYSVDLPPWVLGEDRPPPGADEYRWNIANCNTSTVKQGDWLMTEPGRMVGPTNQGMRDLIAQDPDAYWDDATQSVQGSDFAVSPRIVLIPMHDPHIAIENGRSLVKVIKIAAYFMERTTGQAEVRGRFLKVRAPGEPCPEGVSQGFFTYNLSLIR